MADAIVCGHITGPALSPSGAALQPRSVREIIAPTDRIPVRKGAAACALLRDHPD
jgi:hypothetical protein